MLSRPPECSAVEPLPVGAGVGGATAQPSCILKPCFPRLWRCLQEIFDNHMQLELFVAVFSCSFPTKNCLSVSTRKSTVPIVKATTQ